MHAMSLSFESPARRTDLLTAVARPSATLLHDGYQKGLNSICCVTAWLAGLSRHCCFCSYGQLISGTALLRRPHLYLPLLSVPLCVHTERSTTLHIHSRGNACQQVVRLGRARPRQTQVAGLKPPAKHQLLSPRPPNTPFHILRRS